MTHAPTEEDARTAPLKTGDNNATGNGDSMACEETGRAPVREGVDAGRVDELLSVAWELSTWAGSINWRGGENQKEWLDDLCTLIERFQDKYRQYRAVTPVRDSGPHLAPSDEQGLLAALRELVFLKDAKLSGRISGDEYYERKPKAWEAARLAIQNHEKGKV